MVSSSVLTFGVCLTKHSSQLCRSESESVLRAAARFLRVRPDGAVPRAAAGIVRPGFANNASVRGRRSV